MKERNHLHHPTRYRYSQSDSKVKCVMCIAVQKRGPDRLVFLLRSTPPTSFQSELSLSLSLSIFITNCCRKCWPKLRREKERERVAWCGVAITRRQLSRPSLPLRVTKAPFTASALSPLHKHTKGRRRRRRRRRRRGGRKEGRGNVKNCERGSRSTCSRASKQAERLLVSIYNCLLRQLIGCN